MALPQLYFGQFVLFVLVFTRISGLIMTAPVFGTQAAPMRVRALLALGIALIITPMQAHHGFDPPHNLIEMLLMVGRELMLGLSIGLAIMILFTALQLAGQIIGHMGGMALADVFDPTFNANVPVFTQLLNMVAISVFFAIGGHRQVMRALLDTFETRPPGGDDFPPNLAETLVTVLGESFSVGIRAAAPVMLALLLSMLVLGLISRTLPQLNILVVGFSINSLVMLGTFSICLGSIVAVVTGESADVIELIRTAIMETPLPQPP